VDHLKVESPISHRLVEAVTVDFTAEAEPWETFVLEDGSVVKMRVTPNSIMRLEGEFDAGGNPIYVINNSVAIRVIKSKIRGEPTPQSPPTTGKQQRDPAVG